MLLISLAVDKIIQVTGVKVNDLLARRNINAITRNDLIGRRYSVEKHIVGSNQHTSNSQKSWNQNDTSLRTRGKIADQLNIGEATVQRAEKLSKAIDVITAKPYRV